MIDRPQPTVGDHAVLGFGGAPLGNLFAAISDEDADAALTAAWDAGVRCYDTAPLYGAGLSEERIGRFLAGRPAGQAIVSTKVGRTLVPDGTQRRARDGYLGHPLRSVPDFGRDAIRRSLEDSLRRLRLDRVDTVYLHDPEAHLEQVVHEAYPALRALRDEGLLRHIGVGTNHADTVVALVGAIDLDCALLAGRWTLLDRQAGDVALPLCHQRGIAVHAAGVFNSGLLATADADAPYDYGAAPTAVVSYAKRLRQRCESHGVPIGAAAVQFAARHAAVQRVVVGVRSADEMHTDLAWASHPVPLQLWRELGTPAEEPT